MEFTAVLQDSMFFPLISYITRLQENKERGDAEEVEAVHTNSSLSKFCNERKRREDEKKVQEIFVFSL